MASYRQSAQRAIDTIAEARRLLQSMASDVAYDADRLANDIEAQIEQAHRPAPPPADAGRSVDVPTARAETIEAALRQTIDAAVEAEINGVHDIGRAKAPVITDESDEADLAPVLSDGTPPATGGSNGVHPTPSRDTRPSTKIPPKPRRKK